MRKKIIIGGIIILLIAVGGASYIIVNNKIKKENALKIVQLNKQKADEKKAYDKKNADEKALVDAKAIEDAKAQAKAEADAKAKALEYEKVVGEQRVYIMMHGMINTKIIATDGEVWGEIPITTEGCNKLIEIVNNNNYADKKILLQYLNSWKKKDFSNGVAQHNYIWEKLDGVEGKAYKLR